MTAPYRGDYYRRLNQARNGRSPAAVVLTRVHPQPFPRICPQDIVVLVDLSLGLGSRACRLPEPEIENSRSETLEVVPRAAAQSLDREAGERNKPHHKRAAQHTTTGAPEMALLRFLPRNRLAARPSDKPHRAWSSRLLSGIGTVLRDNDAGTRKDRDLAWHCSARCEQR
jgi:hypothetical protein